MRIFKNSDQVKEFTHNVTFDLHTGLPMPTSPIVRFADWDQIEKILREHHVVIKQEVERGHFRKEFEL